MNEKDVIWDEQRFNQKIICEDTALGEEKVLFGDRWWGKLAPTDIDLMFEMKNKSYVFTEFKVKGTDFFDLTKVNGQRLALERTVYDLGLMKPTLGIFVEHDTPKDEDIIARECIPTAIYIRKDCYSEPQWYVLHDGRTLYEIIFDFFKNYVPKYEEEYAKIRNGINRMREERANA